MDILDMYKKVFEDCVKTRLDDMKEEEAAKITKDDIADIAYKLIYKNDYLWEIINETIDTYIGICLQEKERNDN